MSDLPHFDDEGQSRMVDVGDKVATHRVARAGSRPDVARDATTDPGPQGPKRRCS